MPTSVSLNRRQFLQRIAVFAGVIPLATFIPPLRSPLPLSVVTRSPSATTASHGILVLDSADSPRARFIADSLAEAGFATAIAESIDAIPRAVSQLQGQSRLHLIGLGDAIDQAVRLANGSQFDTLILDSADGSDRDLLAHFDRLKTMSITTLIVHDLTARDTLLRIIDATLTH